MKFTCYTLLLCFIITLFMGVFPPLGVSQTLFNYIEIPQHNLQAVQQWTKIQKRHPKEDIPSASKSLQKWDQYLQKIQHFYPAKQLIAINTFTNNHPYILDIINYGVKDYWAIVREFLQNNGDCEDFAITKFYSLRRLGFKNNQLRIVILQDTNLKIAHAVLAVYETNDIVILDNQVNQIMSHNDIKHYTPIYSINENGWWLHLPPM